MTPTADKTGLDLTDIPTVAAEDIALVLTSALEAERALVFLRGATKTDREAIEARFWRSFRGDTRTGVAVLIRFWALVDAFGSRRLRSSLLDAGYGLIETAIRAAADLRLNASWGFVPQRLLNAILAEAAAAPPLRPWPPATPARPMRRPVVAMEERLAA